MAPELLMRDEILSDDGSEWLLIQKANQFALGMVGWTLMQGRVPYASSQQTPINKINSFDRASKQFSKNVLEAPRADEVRAFTRIISKMVAAEPEDRWEDMKQVNRLIGALSASYEANQLENAVKEAYRTIWKQNGDFYRRFYENLFRRVPSLRAKFPEDMTDQYRLLHLAIGQLLNYNQQQGEPTTLTRYAESHGGKKLSAEDFKEFGYALVDTFHESLPDNGDRETKMAALEIVIWPGIGYMIERCAQRSSV
jgi:hemoglobin-like flavoprotein